MTKKTIIHVNQHKIRRREKKPLTIKTYNSNNEADTAAIIVDGIVVARVVYRPEHPLSFGARVWIETNEIVISGEENELTLNSRPNLAI